MSNNVDIWWWNFEKEKHQKAYNLSSFCTPRPALRWKRRAGCLSFFAPDLYQKIMSPVRQCLQSAVELGAHTAAEVSAWWSALTAPEEDLADPQLAGEPAILSEGPISDPSLTELKESDGKEVLTGESSPSFIITRGMRPGRSSHMAATTSGTTAADPPPWRWLCPAWEIGTGTPYRWHSGLWSTDTGQRAAGPIFRL